METHLAGLIALDGDRRSSLARMGDKSEAFCRQALSMLAQNPQIVPPGLRLSEAQSGLDALDRLRPRLQRLQCLSERGHDSEVALGSDVMNCALQGYALLKVSGKNLGLDGLLKDLSARFTRPARSIDTAPEAEPV